MDIFKLSNGQNFQLEIIVPINIEINIMPDKVRFVGTKDQIADFALQFNRLKELKEGQLCKLDRFTLKVSEYITSDQNKLNWIELPNHAWGIMASKFYEVANEYEDNPFNFNDCGYTDKIPFDVGVEVTDLPIRYLEFKEDGTYYTKQIERNKNSL